MAVEASAFYQAPVLHIGHTLIQSERIHRFASLNSENGVGPTRRRAWTLAHDTRQLSEDSSVLYLAAPAFRCATSAGAVSIQSRDQQHRREPAEVDQLSGGQQA